MSFYFDVVDIFGNELFKSAYYSSIKELEHSVREYVKENAVNITLFQTNDMLIRPIGFVEYDDIRNEVNIRWSEV